MTATIQQTVDELHRTLIAYIEATYHIADPLMVRQRRELLVQEGGIFRRPFLESTPRYQTGSAYSAMTDLPEAARQAFVALSSGAVGKPLLFDPPYKHQAAAIRTILRDARNLMIMTGTGSGKTESFLLPILGKLAVEARERPAQFHSHAGVRAMVLYPMNALVNDQLGRLRALFGAPEVVALFEAWAGRPARFARYTSRTPYAGIRTKAKDIRRLKSIADFFVRIDDAAERHLSGTPVQADEDAAAFALRETLRSRGKWPAKPSISDWHGSGDWLGAQEEFIRAVTLDHDAELLTRDEVQRTPPDLLITNYSMLEYMMLRPIERPIFDQTRAWLAACPDENFLVVLDEAHLYRGAQGAEVGLLLRRLRERLGIALERFQVICATASFSDAGKANAGAFGAALSGRAPDTFDPVPGDLLLRPGEAVGEEADVDALCAIDMAGFYDETTAVQRAAVDPFLTFRGAPVGPDLEPDLHAALRDYGPLARLVNGTMSAAKSLDEVRELVFPTAQLERGEAAVSALLALGSRAREKPGDASLLPCRVHAFYRGLPGLWVCMDADCAALAEPDRGGPAGKLYGQPRARCTCGAPVLEYYTCRSCGCSYARAYARDLDHPEHLYAEAGQFLVTDEGVAESFHKIDLLLEAPATATQGRPAFYDLVTGRLDPTTPSERQRVVYVPPGLGSVAGGLGDDEDEDSKEPPEPPAGPGQFAPCGCCGRRASHGRSTVQDHLTKGDQPFQALLAAQIKVQPPSPRAASEFAPLRGRKVLIFSDSRQVAARLAPTLQNYSLKDAIRALLPAGYRAMQADPVLAGSLVLDQGWVAAVVAAHRFGVRLRPELEASEVMPRLVDTAPGVMPSTAEILDLRNEKPPVNLTRAVMETLRDNLLGLEPLAIASVAEVPKLTVQLEKLPDIVGLASDADTKIAVVRAWLRAWTRNSGVWLRDMPPNFWGTGALVKPHKGDFTAMKHVLAAPGTKTQFKKLWLDVLIKMFTQDVSGLKRLSGQTLTLDIGGDWRRCGRCTSVHRPIPTVATCIDCGSADVGAFDPETDAVFRARKAFYRDPVAEALHSEHPRILSLIAAEHTAQLNATRADEAFSAAERHEMRFQDIDLAWRTIDPPDTSIDVLSSTTTMEVGIDIGELSGVALRNMPPGRANYQQRAGRAGRRGNAVATVVAFGSADSHDEHYFSRPAEMIRGQVVDPRLVLENPDIARRHIRAFLLQRYHEARLPALDPHLAGAGNLFSVLGTVRDFRDGTGLLNRTDFKAWLEAEAALLREAIDRWLPGELAPADRQQLLDTFVGDVTVEADRAIYGGEAAPPTIVAEGEAPLDVLTPWDLAEETDETAIEADPAPDAEGDLVDAAADNLLDRLLYWGVLPRYAFPTDVAPFYVFSQASTGFRPEMEFAPSQGLNVALSQYAPNKHVWIRNKQYTSKALYSPFRDDLRNAWGRRRLYYECGRCGHAETDTEFDRARQGEVLACKACQAPASFGPAKPWIRPPGFAHPWGRPAVTTPDEPNETAHATRAKLVMPTPGPDEGTVVNPRIRALATRRHLLVSNSGPGGDGYVFCVGCGRIESVSSPDQNLYQAHTRPYPTKPGEEMCPGFTSKGVVLGADFPTDIALFALKVEAPFRLPPGHSESQSAMRTVCEALAKAACRLLELESGEILAEYRPALNDEGAAGSLVEVFLYDTLAGGAGFSPQLVPRAAELFETALGFVVDCPEACDASCYRCLRSFRNRLDHAWLDRHLAAQLLRSFLQGGAPDYPADRVEQSVGMLSTALRLQLADTHDVTRSNSAGHPPIEVMSRTSGVITPVDLTSPIAPSLPLNAPIGLARLVLVDDLKVRRHLGEAVEKVIAAL